MNAEAAYALLASVLEDFAPPCNGHDVFTSDYLSDLERAVCASICDTCPIADPCGAYARAASVDSGFWAGVDRSPKRKRVASTTADRTASGTHRKETP